MKKTLTALCFAMCASVAFGQANHNLNKTVKVKNLHQANMEDRFVAKDPMTSKPNYFFTKDDTIKVFQFNVAATDAQADYSLGTIAAGEVIDGNPATPHAHSAAFAAWKRWIGTDSQGLTSQGFATLYPQIGANFLEDEYMATLLPDSLTSSANGWMGMVPYEDQGAHTGDINAYIALGSIDVSEVSKFSVRLFQYYRKYYDMCFVDYSTDNGATWHAVEINVTGVDVSVNTNLWGRYNYSMPNAAAAGSNVLLRIRMFSDRREHRTNAYGYWWFLDDVAIVKSKNNSLKQQDVRYWEGAYQTLPQNLATSIEWASDVTNTGVLPQNNVQLKIDHISGNGAVTNIATQNLGNIAVDSTGSYDVENLAGLNAGTIGDNYVTSTITTDSLTLAYDTIFYDVKGAEADGTFIWGRDNGVLTAGAAYMFGYTDDGYITDESEHFVEQNYSTYVSYATGATVPENWVIRGIQYVAASSDDAFAEGASFIPTLIMDSTVEDGIILRSINLGVDPRTTSMADYNDSTLIVEGSGYLTAGNYNVINIELKKQPALIPNQTYRVGYRMAQNGVFAVAASATSTYTQLENDTLWRKRFDGDASTKKYASNFTLNNEQLPNYYAVYTIDPEGEDGIWGAGYYYGRYPMIRMIVGPKVEYPTHQINVTCNMEGEYGEAYFSDGSTYACGESTEVVDGLSDYIYIVPEADVQFTMTDNGTNVPMSELEPIDDGEGGYYYVYTMSNITADHNIVINYTVGIDEVASLVSMKLQPNPATSQVKLNIEGVTGMVDCALIDMCGRVVYSTKMNAETAQTINVSNLAKGAYFVRITNNDFTKVEKLVVR